MAFADEVKIHVEAGDGGNGLASFQHSRNMPKGGPDGGDGGNGGSIYLIADHNESSLAPFLRERHLRAEHGERGWASKCSGKSGQDMVLKVPVGTQIVAVDTEKRKVKEFIIADLNADGVKFKVAAGGKGGFGNARFARSNFQVPRFAELGEPGEDKDIILRLKLIAEVGIIGLPNAGKSTLLSVISNARPKIADYAFTTLIPNLGIVDASGKRFLVADIPGIIEGAHQGKGLGIDFLKHVERTKLLWHLIDATQDDPKTQFKIINTELKKYSKDLAREPQIIVFTKIDAITPEKLKAIQKLKFTGRPVFYISGAAHTGVADLLQETVRQLKAIPNPSVAVKVYTLADLPSTRFEVEKIKGKLIVKGDKIEKLLIRTDLDNEQALGRLYKVLRRMGVLSELRKIGAKEGNMVKIGQKTIEYKEI
ncbi:MAG: GTPase ObgE [Patescibacteria group bacterium]|jgi:GTP-binding protein